MSTTPHSVTPEVSPEQVLLEELTRCGSLDQDPDDRKWFNLFGSKNKTLNAARTALKEAGEKLKQQRGADESTLAPLRQTRDARVRDLLRLLDPPTWSSEDILIRELQAKGKLPLYPTAEPELSAWLKEKSALESERDRLLKVIDPLEEKAKSENRGTELDSTVAPMSMSETDESHSLAEETRLTAKERDLLRNTKREYQSCLAKLAPMAIAEVQQTFEQTQKTGNRRNSQIKSDKGENGGGSNDKSDEEGKKENSHDRDRVFWKNLPHMRLFVFPAEAFAAPASALA